MTLCIAAWSDTSKVVVTASDTMLSDDWSSVETLAPKVATIGPKHRWLSMYTGNPTLRQRIVNERMAACLPENADDTAAGVAAAFVKAHGLTLREMIEAKVLSPFGMDLPTFLRRGLRSFGPDEFSRIMDEIRAVKTDTEFLVAGWEAAGPIFRMFSMGADGTIEYHDALGFWAVGSGWVQALGMLYRTYHPQLSTNELIYRVCEAKFAGEVAPRVGKLTAVVLLKSDGTQFRLSVSVVDRLRQIHEQNAPHVPENALEVIARAVGDRA